MDHTEVSEVSIDDVDSLSALELAHLARTLIVDANSNVSAQPEVSLYRSSLVHVENAIALLEHAIKFCHRQNKEGGIEAQALAELEDLEQRVRLFALGIINFANATKVDE